ncbi:hypothetical protein NDU88_005232 [Pleurodeles waltl]|uniref:Secreted protein n=1 Tax=Pleurodeles waltl TaxID=8319 RepID=A0AAV7L497_PLEWA|nr:hypothetical protein NDU88_005232 [Pleurodeles waltl]
MLARASLVHTEHSCALALSHSAVASVTCTVGGHYKHEACVTVIVPLLYARPCISRAHRAQMCTLSDHGAAGSETYKVGGHYKHEACVTVIVPRLYARPCIPRAHRAQLCTRPVCTVPSLQ